MTWGHKQRGTELEFNGPLLRSRAQTCSVHFLVRGYSFSHSDKEDRTVGSGMGNGQPCWGQDFQAWPGLGSMASRLIEQPRTFHRKEIRLPYIYKYTARLPVSRNRIAWGGQSDQGWLPQSAPHAALMKKKTCTANAA